MTTPAARATAARLFRPRPVTAGVAPDVTLISRYRVDGGSAVDDVGGVNATLVGTFGALDTGSLVQGVAGTSLFKTDGTAHLLLPANNPAHDLSALTVSFYYQPFASDHKHILFTGGTDGVNAIGDFSIERLTNGRLRAWHVGQDGGLRFFEDTSGIAATNLLVNVAVRITATFGPGSARIYVNDTEVSSIPENTNGWTNISQKYLGVWQDGTLDPTQGVLDHLRIWDGELQASGVAALQPATPIVIAQDDGAGVLTDSTGNFLGVLENDSGLPTNRTITITQAPAVGTATAVNNGTASADISYDAPASPGSATIKYTVDGSNEATVSINITSSGSGIFACVTTGTGTLVDLGNQTDNETTTHLSTGGNARYDASGIIKRIRWLGQQGCCSPNRHTTTEQFLFRWTADANGGCISGASWYGNLTPHEDYDGHDDPDDPGGPCTGANFSLYPCADQGGMYVRVKGGSVQNFTIEGVRSHGAWDPIRTPRDGSEVHRNTTVKGSWFTCIRDDAWENDSYIDGAVCTDNLIGDVIGSGPTNAGCFRFYSLAGSFSDHTAKTVTITNNLVWASQMRASGRNRNIASYAVGPIWKIRSGNCPKIVCTDNIFMADALAFGGESGDPLAGFRSHLSRSSNPGVSSGNILIWRDLGNNGSYTSLWGSPPAGFTILEGSEGEQEWNLQVNNWKASHPSVRRFNILNIDRPYGVQSHDGNPTFDLVDVG